MRSRTAELVQEQRSRTAIHGLATPLAEVEGPVARSQGPRAEAKATRARGLANPAEDSIRQARFKTEMRACAGRQRSARRTYEGAEGEDDIITESSEEKRDRKRCPAPGRSRPAQAALSADELRMVGLECSRDVLLSAAAVLGAAP